MCADGPFDPQVLEVHTNSSDCGEADRVAVAFKVLLLPSFFAQAVKADTKNKHAVQPVSPLLQESAVNMISTDMHQVSWYFARLQIGACMHSCVSQADDGNTGCFAGV